MKIVLVVCLLLAVTLVNSQRPGKYVFVNYNFNYFFVNYY